MKTRNIFIGILLIALVAVGGVWLWNTRAQASSDAEILEATGVIEARRASLSPEVGGQVIDVLVEEGQRVSAGQPLVRLDDALLTAQRGQTLAALQAAQANLSLLKTGARDEQIAAAQAQLAQAEASLRMAQANLALIEAGATPEQISAAEAQLAQAEANSRMTQANLNALTLGTQPEVLSATQTNLDRAWDRYNNLRVILTNDQLEAMRSALTTAEDNLAAAQAHRDDHIANDSRNPDFVIAAFSEAVADAETDVSFAQLAYEAAQNDSQPYVRQIELARQSWEAAQSSLSMAQARYDGLAADGRTTSDALEAAQDILDNVKELEKTTQDAYDTLTSGSAALQLEAAWKEVQRLQVQLGSYARVSAGAGGTVLSVEALLDQIDAAAAQDDMAAANLDALVNGARDEAVEVAQAQVDAAAAQRDMAAANLAALVNGARAEELAAAQAQVNAAQAQLEALDVQLAKFTITAPWDGVVLLRSIEPGETALPGTILLEIGHLKSLKLTVYLPEDLFGRVTPGQQANVRVDAYPDQVFPGVVLRVADEAEFTPTNIQTKEDRTRLVYAVEISLDNPGLLLKPGMIADVTFGEHQE